MRHALIVLLLAASGAHAQFKCVAPDGAVAYQDAACPGGVPLAALEQRVSFYEPPQFRFDLAWSPRHGWYWPNDRWNRGNEHRESWGERRRNQSHAFPSSASRRRNGAGSGPGL